MKKLMMLMVAAVVLPVVSFADMPATVYVVPAGTADNTPTAPYDTWAKAANDIKVAAEQVATHGVVKVLTGTYPSTTGYFTERAYELQVFADTAESTGGKLTLSSPLALDPVADSDPDHHSILVTCGTVAFSDQNVFFDDGGTTKSHSRAKANCKLTFSGADAHLDSSSSYLYIGYWSDGSTVKFTNGATCNIGRVYMGQAYSAGFSSFVVEDEANVVTTVFQAGTSNGADCTVVVSNATLTSGSSGFVFGTSGSEMRTHILLAGAGLKSSGAANFNGDTELRLDVSELPVEDWSDYLFYNTRLSFDETASCVICGTDAFRARLRAAGVRSKTFNKFAIGYAGGQSMNVPDAVLNATNARLAGSGFSVVRRGTSYLDFKFSDPGHDQQIVYLDSANDTPAQPYISWDTAAETLSDAKLFVATNGTLMIASGTYDTDFLAPEEAVTVRAVASPNDDTPGEVTIKSTIFPGYKGTNTNEFYRKLTLASGTFNTAETVFVDSNSGGDYGANSSNCLVVSGSNTVFNEANNALYIGYAAQNTKLIVTDGAKCYGSTIYSGRGLSYGEGSTVVVKDGATFSCTAFSQGQEAAGATLVVDNATMSGSASFTSGKSGTSLGERVIVKGEAPYLSFKNALQFFGNTVLEFDVSDLKLGTVDNHDARLFTATFQMRDDATLKITGVEKLKARHEADESAKPRIKYPLIYAWSGFELSDEKFAAAAESANLPDGWTLTKDARYVYLTIRKPIGMMIIVR